MTRIFLNILFLTTCGIFFLGCNIFTDKNRYQGFEKAIDIAHIKSVPGDTTAKILNIKIPVSNSLTFNYNKSLKDVDFVKLETTAQSKFGTIDKIFITNNRIIVVDFNISKGVFIFDSHGRFINKIPTNKNEVAADYIDAAYDYSTNEIIIHAINQSRSFYFDTNGNFKNKSKEYIYFSKFANLKNTDKFVYINGFGGNGHIPALNKSSIYIGKKNTEILYTATDVIKNMKSDINYDININPSINNGNDKIFYTPEFSDTVYRIDGNPVNVYPKLVIHYPGININTKIKEDNKEGIEEYIRLINKNLYYSFKGQIFCNSDSIYFIATYKNGFSGYFYSEKTNKIIGGNLVSNLLPTDSAQLDGYKYPATTFNDYFVSILSSSDFGNRKGLSSIKLSEIKKGIKPTDNPILVFYKLKDFN